MSKSVYDKSVQRKRGDVSLSAFSFLYSETIQYLYKQATGIADLEDRLNQLGYHAGSRVIELATVREGKTAKRETSLVGLLQLLQNQIWRSVFGRAADVLEKSTESDNQYMLIDRDPLICEYISVPKEMKQLNCAAFAAGLIEAVLVGGGFPSKVTAHSMGSAEAPYKTVFLVELR